MNRSRIASAVAARDRGRSMVRSLTAITGVGGIAATGAIAFILPGAAARHTADTGSKPGISRPPSAASTHRARPAGPSSAGAAKDPHPSPSPSTSRSGGSGGSSGSAGSGGFSAGNPPSSSSGSSNATSGGTSAG